MKSQISSRSDLIFTVMHKSHIFWPNKPHPHHFWQHTYLITNLHIHFVWTLTCLFALFLLLAYVCLSCSVLILNCKCFLFANTGYSGIWVRHSGFYATSIKIKIIINYSFNEDIYLICKAWQDSILWSIFNSLLSILISTKPVSFIYISGTPRAAF